MQDENELVRSTDTVDDEASLLGDSRSDLNRERVLIPQHRTSVDQYFGDVLDLMKHEAR